MRGKILFFILLFSVVSHNAFGMRGTKGQWIGSGGFGLNLSPMLIMISPQLEYIYKPDLSIGPLAQLAFGSGGVLFTVTGTVRWVFNRTGKILPVLEGGLGLAMASSTLFTPPTSSVGVHLMTGFGADYLIDASTSIGSMIRLNFAPPIKSFYITWPLIIGRFLL